MPPTLTAPGPLVERFPIRLNDGTVLRGSCYRTWRRGGRRIIVRDDAEKVLFDTDDMHDLDNATNKLDLWLAETYPA